MGTMQKPKLKESATTTHKKEMLRKMSSNQSDLSYMISDNKGSKHLPMIKSTMIDKSRMKVSKSGIGKEEMK